MKVEVLLRGLIDLDELGKEIGESLGFLLIDVSVSQGGAGSSREE